jgi:hypothetical protein
MRLRFALFAILFLAFTSVSASAQWQWGRPHPPREGACFYRDANFSGEYFCLKVGERWPAMPRGFNDQISSIRVFRGARVRIFNNDNFGGMNVRINHSVDSLIRIRMPQDLSKSWNDRISSIAVYLDHDDWDRGHP